MVKPQFEVGRERLGSGGVVRLPALWVDAVVGVARAAAELGLAVRDVVRSPLPGPSGNVEFFLWLARSDGADPVQVPVDRITARRAGGRGGGPVSRRALVVTHGGREEAVSATHDAVRELERAGVEAVLAAEDAVAADLPTFELAIVLGGDGTILRAAELHARDLRPVARASTSGTSGSWPRASARTSARPCVA